MFERTKCVCSCCSSCVIHFWNITLVEDSQSLQMLCDSHYNSHIGIFRCICLQSRESNLRLKQLESDISFHIGKQEAELALRVNSAAFHGDLHQLKSLVRGGGSQQDRLWWKVTTGMNWAFELLLFIFIFLGTSPYQVMGTKSQRGYTFNPLALSVWSCEGAPDVSMQVSLGLRKGGLWWN